MAGMSPALFSEAQRAAVCKPVDSKLLSRLPIPREDTRLRVSTGGTLVCGRLRSEVEAGSAGKRGVLWDGSEATEWLEVIFEDASDGAGRRSPVDGSCGEFNKTLLQQSDHIVTRGYCRMVR
jgi:hypothetical protein